MLSLPPASGFTGARDYRGDLWLFSDGVLSFFSEPIENIRSTPTESHRIIFIDETGDYPVHSINLQK